MEEYTIAGLEIQNNEGKSNIKYESGKEEDHHIAVQSVQAWSLSDSSPLYYFEVSIKNAVNAIGVGVAFKDFPSKGRMPGWLPGSFAYHGDDGNRFTGRQPKGGWPLFGTNDVVGVGLKTSTKELFATLNGKFLGLLANVSEANELIPTIGFNASGEVDLHFDSKDFKFDLTSLPANIVPSFGELEKIDINSPKLLVLYVNGVADEEEKEKLIKVVREAAESVKSNHGYQSFFTSQNEGIALNVRKLVGIYDKSPLLVAIHLEEDSKYSFPLESESLTGESLAKFLEDAKAGRITKLRKSAPRPANDASSKVPTLTEVVASSFDELVVGGTKDVLLDVFANWCGPCKAIAPTIALLSEIFADNDNIVIAKIDCDANDIDRTYLPETSIPNIKLFRGNNKKEPVKYQGNRSLVNFLEFLHQNATVPFDLEAAKEKGQQLQVAQKKKELKNAMHVQTAEEFNTHINSGMLIIVDYYATWCGPCKFIAPVFADLSEAYPQAIFLKVDVDELKEVAKEQDITCMPTFKAYKGGKEVGKLEGADEDELKELVTKNL